MIDCVAGNNTFSHPSFRIQCTFRLQDAISFSPAISAFPIYGQAGENSPNRRHFARRHAAKVGPSTSSNIVWRVLYSDDSGLPPVGFASSQTVGCCHRDARKLVVLFASQSWMVVKYAGANRCNDAISALLPTLASSWR